MPHGFFGGFILGFLGTSLPRLWETRSLKTWETGVPAMLLLGSTLSHLAGRTGLGDFLFVMSSLLLGWMLARLYPQRRDLAPPGFTLLQPAFASGFAGLTLLHLANHLENPAPWELLGRLWSYHALVLLCLLGAGSFLLPRFLGMGARQRFECSPHPNPQWCQARTQARLAGWLIVATYPMEAFHSSGLAGLLRTIVMGVYLGTVMPWRRYRWSWKGVQWQLSLGLLLLPVGIVAAGWLPGNRVGLAHFELLGGFGLITLAVAARVVYGHCGKRSELEAFHPTLSVAGSLMILGLLTRVSGDWIPAIMTTHYLYGALCWTGGLLLWSVRILPGLRWHEEKNPVGT